jgi:hypothetical protein
MDAQQAPPSRAFVRIEGLSAVSVFFASRDRASPKEFVLAGKSLRDVAGRRKS